MTLDENEQEVDRLIEVKKSLTKLTELIDRDLAHAQDKWYEDFDYTPRSTKAYERAKERTEADDTPFLIRDLIDNLPAEQFTNYYQQSGQRTQRIKPHKNTDNISLNRFVLRLYYISGTTHTEIALRLGLAQSTTSDRLKGLRKIVRESNETKTD